MVDEHILVCQCAGRAILPEAVKSGVLAGLRGGSAPFSVVEDLCGRCAARDPALLELAQRSATLTEVACHARAVRWLLHAAGVKLPAERLRVLDMRSSTVAAILEPLSRAPSGELPPAADVALPASPAAADWPPWFPVIDLDRCCQCRQCLSFCLFGVYSLSPEGKVAVTHPQNCKNNCPACSRICPEAAIMFPKLEESEAPLNGGEIRDEAELKARAQVNMKEVLGSDVYAALAERRRLAQARRLRRPPAVAQAERERAAHFVARKEGC